MSGQRWVMALCALAVLAVNVIGIQHANAGQYERVAQQSLEAKDAFARRVLLDPTVQTFSTRGNSSPKHVKRDRWIANAHVIAAKTNGTELRCFAEAVTDGHRFWFPAVRFTCPDAWRPEPSYGHKSAPVKIKLKDKT